MLEKEIENALTTHRPELPRGFAERSDARTLKVMTEHAPGRRKPIVLAAISTFVLLLGAITSLAAANEEVNALLYEWWPEAAKALMPVNLVCEDQGIRMEILSAALEKDKLLVSFSLQDLKGERITENTYAFLELEDNAGGSCEATSGTASYDEKEKKITIGQYGVYDRSVPVIGGELIARIEDVSSWRETQVDLTPYLSDLDTQAKTMAVPADAEILECLEETEIPETLRVLDCRETAFIPLKSGVELAGIGLIDGQLHVQLHYTSRRMMEYEENNAQVSMPSLLGSVTLFLPETEHMDHEKLPNGINKLGWGSKDESLREWEEYIFSGCPEADNETVFRCQIREFNAPIFGNWEVKIPARLIQGNR